jgi:hypothetical protein
LVERLLAMSNGPGRGELCSQTCSRDLAFTRGKSLCRKEAPVGIEPTNRGFADLCLTTWLRRRKKRKVATHYEFGKSCGAFRGAREPVHATV